MKRFITQKLLQWKNSEHRKPLILQGARQVGKTYILQDFGRTYYDSVAYFNFERADNLGEIFKNTKDPSRLIEQLSLFNNQKITPGKTLIIFDEIQECPEALNSLKYFNEEANQYHIACAGSLLGIRLAYSSFPVGKVDFLHLYPMSLSEFLIADGSENLVEVMRQATVTTPIPAPFATALEEKLRAYFVIGGMPEVVASWTSAKDITEVDKIQQNILQSYENDFAKHVSVSKANKISLIWQGIPSQLAHENKKFIYQAIRPGARAREYENALNWLTDADLISKCSLVKKCALPLKSYQDLSCFKIYLSDIGLLRQMAGLSSSHIFSDNPDLAEFKGALTENYIINALHSSIGEDIYYYAFGRYEIDFILQTSDSILPIEVKSGHNANHTSLTRFNASHDNPLSILFSRDNIKKSGIILNLPLYLAEYLTNFL